MIPEKTNELLTRFGAHLLIDVAGPGLAVADALESAGVKLARVRRSRDGAWREVTENSVEAPQAPKP